MNPESVGEDGFSPGGVSLASTGQHNVGMLMGTNINNNNNNNNNNHHHQDHHGSSSNNVHLNADDPAKGEAADNSSNGATSAGASPAEPSLAGKKRKAMVGSRGVANLTPEQLAKKRANDREAQRAIRERTKNTIEALQHRIHDLTNMDHMLELQKAQQAREYVERENADIKRRLITIMGMIEPLVHAQMEPQPCIPPTPQTYTPSLAIHSASALGYNSPSTTNSASPAASLQQQQHQQPQQQQQQQHHIPPHHAQAQAWQVNRNVTPIQVPSVGVGAGLDEYTRSQLEQQRHYLQHHFEMGQERLNLNYVLSPDNHGRPLAGVPKIERGINGAQDSPAFHHIPMKHDWTQVQQEPPPPPRPSWEGGGGGPPRYDPNVTGMSAPPVPSHHDPHGMAGGYMGFNRGNGGFPAYAMPTNTCPPTCPLDSLLLDCIQERRQRRNEGHEPHRVAGPQYPSVSSLLNPENARYSHPLSKFFTDIIAKFPDIAKLPERVAVLYVMFVFMRWQVLLSPETYGQLPEWMIPRPCQLTKPHPIWIDYLPFPEMRERLVELYNPEEYSFDNFFVPYTKTLVLSWPYEGTDTLLQDPASEEIMINPVFYRHLKNLDNWKLMGYDFERAFPKLAGSYNRG